MQTTTNTNVQKLVSSNWIKQEKETYTSDELINAYLQGKNEGQSQKVKILLDALGKNISLAQYIIESINEEIIKNNFNSLKSYLRIKSLNIFDAVFTIELEDYLSDDFDKVYKLSREYKNKNNTDSFNINTTFMPVTDSLNEERLISDGFYLIYEKQN